MTEKDLRIGNLIEFLGEVREVEAIDNLPKRPDMYWIKTKGMIPHKIFQYKPIPLTEEWLVKFGFEIVRFREPQYHVGMDWFYKYDYAIIRIKKGSGRADDIVIRFKDGKFKLDNYRSIEFDYVHQLQNFVHSIGEELKLKEDKFYCEKCKSEYPCSTQNFGIKCDFEIEFEIKTYGKENEKN